MVNEFEEKLKAHIAEIEAKSPVELVPVIVKKADDYHAWSLVFGFVFAYFPASLLSRYLPIWSIYSVAVEGLMWILLGVFLAFVLRKAPGLLSRLIPKPHLQEMALERAESLFLHEGVNETRERLGILIAVFEFEKAVIVLADRGFNGHVSPDYWPRLGSTLAREFSHDKPGDEFFQVLHEIEREIAPKFKVKGDNPDELSNELRRK